MLRFFRYNDPYRLLVVLFILVVIGFSLFTFSQPLTVQELKGILLGEALNDRKALYIELIDNSTPFYAWLCKLLGAIFGRGLAGRHVFALILIFFQASYFAILLIKNKAYNENNYLPALIFALLCCCSFDFFHLSPNLVGSVILLFALNNLFREIEFRVQRDETVLNLGLYLGLASLLVFSYSIYLLGTLLILILFTRISLKKIALLMVGFLLPHAFLILFYWFNNHQGDLMSRFYVANLTLANQSLMNAKTLLMIGLLPMVYFAFSLIMLNREARFTKYQSQLLQVMMVWLLIAFIEIIFTRERSAHSLITLAPSLAYFISHYLLLIRRKRIAETMLWIFIIGIPLIAWAGKNGKIKPIDTSGLMLPPEASSPIHKRIVILDNQLPIYQNNHFAGFFLNPELSKEIWQNPDIYENVILMNSIFEKDAPEVIIDPQDWMKPFLNRLPKWKKEYVREGIYYKPISK